MTKQEYNDFQKKWLRIPKEVEEDDENERDD